MTGKSLYKNRYLIAVYDNNENLVDVLCNSREVWKYCRAFYRKNEVSYSKYKFYLIDCLEKHNDIFKEEDKIFLEEFEETRKSETRKNVENLMKKYNISLRTAYRKYKVLKNYENDEKTL